MSKKITKREMFTKILARTTDLAEREFLAHEIELLDNKKANPARPTKEQKEKAEFRDAIYTFLLDLGERMTITEMMTTIPACVEINASNQKVKGAIDVLKREGKVERTEEKGKAYFTAVEVE